jgi:hypothetical protein
MRISKRTPGFQARRGRYSGAKRQGANIREDTNSAIVDEEDIADKSERGRRLEQQKKDGMEWGNVTNIHQTNMSMLGNILMTMSRHLAIFL